VRVDGCNSMVRVFSVLFVPLVVLVVLLAACLQLLALASVSSFVVLLATRYRI
jgi:putative effector of murein hydrolase LrgA (UPF0299 family)